MNEYECIHCGKIDGHIEHWEKCENHPANKIIVKLQADNKRLRGALDRITQAYHYNMTREEIVEFAIKALQEQGEK